MRRVDTIEELFADAHASGMIQPFTVIIRARRFEGTRLPDPAAVDTEGGPAIVVFSVDGLPTPRLRPVRRTAKKG